MMQDYFFWLYLVNGTVLIVHEIDSAYWKEWQMFQMPGGVSFFLALHVPLILLVLWGATQLRPENLAGLIMSLVLALAGVTAFFLHMHFIRKGRPEFRTWISLSILILILALSAAQLAVSVYLLTA
jgi:hypothetical protein